MSLRTGHLYERRLIEKALAVRTPPPGVVPGTLLPLLPGQPQRVCAQQRWAVLVATRGGPQEGALLIRTRRSASLLPCNQETGECPVTKQPLSREDLLPVKTNKVRMSVLWAALRHRGRAVFNPRGVVWRAGAWKPDTQLTRWCGYPTRW